MLFLAKLKCRSYFAAHFCVSSCSVGWWWGKRLFCNLWVCGVSFGLVIVRQYGQPTVVPDHTTVIWDNAVIQAKGHTRTFSLPYTQKGQVVSNTPDTTMHWCECSILLFLCFFIIEFSHCTAFNLLKHLAIPSSIVFGRVTELSHCHLISQAASNRPQTGATLQSIEETDSTPTSPKP